MKILELISVSDVLVLIGPRIVEVAWFLHQKLTSLELKLTERTGRLGGLPIHYQIGVEKMRDRKKHLFQVDTYYLCQGITTLACC